MLDENNKVIHSELVPEIANEPNYDAALAASPCNDDAMRNSIVGLFRVRFRDPGMVLEKVKGDAVYLILAMAPDKVLRMKPQNLVTGLPVRDLEIIT